MFAFIDRCLSTMSHLPRMLRNKAHLQLLAWFPSLLPPLCHPGDILCHETNGLFKLEELLPTRVMEGLDWCSENSNLCGGVACAMLVGGGLLYLYKRRPVKKTETAKQPNIIRKSKLVATD
ncbi:hypothetical protein [Candidatus Berkiella aquae]|uniref:Uncharacterized protein n=1 Tax=Candidatus Berkiella aquae TaxID=295108 RepID=A0A0Q9YRJ0_9GAMM|nr:hypothetical protein [Candidatus Berkiella aquae]MCS5709842.1 hypothetical protein [Candidatus Berkiella aquae]